MSVLDFIRRFLFGPSPEELFGPLERSADLRSSLYEEEAEPEEPSFEWPDVGDSGLLLPDPPQESVPKPPPPPPSEESTDSDSSFRAQLPDRDSGPSIRFQRRPSSRHQRVPISSIGPDDPLNTDLFHKCDVRAFCNRLRQGVNAVYGGNAVPFYRAAGITRSAYSRLISHPDYHPAKRTVLAMAAALHLDLPAAEDFLKLAGYALSPAFREDQVWKYCFSKNIYDLARIRELLARIP